MRKVGREEEEKRKTYYNLKLGVRGYFSSNLSGRRNTKLETEINR